MFIGNTREISQILCNNFHIFRRKDSRTVIRGLVGGFHVCIIPTPAIFFRDLKRHDIFQQMKFGRGQLINSIRNRVSLPGWLRIWDYLLSLSSFMYRKESLENSTHHRRRRLCTGASAASTCRVCSRRLAAGLLHRARLVRVIAAIRGRRDESRNRKLLRALSGPGGVVLEQKRQTAIYRRIWLARRAVLLLLVPPSGDALEFQRVSGRCWRATAAEHGQLTATFRQQTVKVAPTLLLVAIFLSRFMSEGCVKQGRGVLVHFIVDSSAGKCGRHKPERASRNWLCGGGRRKYKWLIARRKVTRISLIRDVGSPIWRCHSAVESWLVIGNVHCVGLQKGSHWRQAAELDWRRIIEAVAEKSEPNRMEASLMGLSVTICACPLCQERQARRHFFLLCTDWTVQSQRPGKFAVYHKIIFAQQLEWKKRFNPSANNMSIFFASFHARGAVTAPLSFCLPLNTSGLAFTDARLLRYASLPCYTSLRTSWRSAPLNVIF
eukprot:284817699_1